VGLCMEIKITKRITNCVNKKILLSLSIIHVVRNLNVRFSMIIL
jgi:hypothetical protein